MTDSFIIGPARFSPGRSPAPPDESADWSQIIVENTWVPEGPWVTSRRYRYWTGDRYRSTPWPLSGRETGSPGVVEVEHVGPAFLATDRWWWTKGKTDVIRSYHDAGGWLYHGRRSGRIGGIIVAQGSAVVGWESKLSVVKSLHVSSIYDAGHEYLPSVPDVVVAPADPDLRSEVLAELRDPRWEFRTPAGIARSLDVSEGEVREALALLGPEVRRPLAPDRSGRELYTAASRRPGWRERWLRLRRRFATW